MSCFHKKADMYLDVIESDYEPRVSRVMPLSNETLTVNINLPNSLIL